MHLQTLCLKISHFSSIWRHSRNVFSFHYALKRCCCEVPRDSKKRYMLSLSTFKRAVMCKLDVNMLSKLFASHVNHRRLWPFFNSKCTILGDLQKTVCIGAHFASIVPIACFDTVTFLWVTPSALFRFGHFHSLIWTGGENSDDWEGHLVIAEWNDSNNETYLKLDPLKTADFGDCVGASYPKFHGDPCFVLRLSTLEIPRLTNQSGSCLSLGWDMKMKMHNFSQTSKRTLVVSL